MSTEMTMKKSMDKTSAHLNKQSKHRPSGSVEVEKNKGTKSEALAKLATTSALSSITLKSFSGCGDDLDAFDLLSEMKKAGDEVVAGDLGRIERMLANQAMTLDAIFTNMALRSHQQQDLKGIEVLMRLALKAQAQARSTAEALALLKNPMPYIKQTNVSTGPQQVNNTYGATPSGTVGSTGAENFKGAPNKLLEADHGQRLDIGAPAAASRADQAMEALGAVHRTEDA